MVIGCAGRAVETTKLNGKALLTLVLRVVDKITKSKDGKPP